ncbi:MAG: YcgN family cysteine cluster protein [Gammaproteobacteria bacterium]|nr:YcgN family cysteine cluster protein [Gammaproteobacteria bacterium]
MKDNFWETKTPQEMTSEEWESLCDGCGRCCLIKLEDEDTQEVYYTNVVCQYFNMETCQCTDYKKRLELVSNCLKIDVEMLNRPEDFPETCAYRLLATGSPLPNWHPLVSDSMNSIHDANISVRGKVVSEEYIHPEQLEEQIILWEPMIFPKADKAE